MDLSRLAGDSDFVPWRFLDASRRARRGLVTAGVRNLHIIGGQTMADAGFTRVGTPGAGHDRCQQAEVAMAW